MCGAMVWPFCRNDSAVMGLLQKKNNNENTEKKHVVSVIVCYRDHLSYRLASTAHIAAIFAFIEFLYFVFRTKPILLYASRSRFARISASALLVFSRNPFPLQRNSVCSAVFRICRRSLLSAAFSESENVSSDMKPNGKHRSWGHGIHTITHYGWCHCWRATNGEIKSMMIFLPCSVCFTMYFMVIYDKMIIQCRRLRRRYRLHRAWFLSLGTKYVGDAAGLVLQ